MTSIKVCSHCGSSKDTEEFYSRKKNGATYVSNPCKSCYKLRDAARWEERKADYRPTKNRPEHVRRHRAKIKQQRADNERSDYFILHDSLKSDRLKGRPNDLDKPFIAEQIAKGCSYCGETEIRITLDRINNEGGHTKDNVVPACYRCNHTRGNMPHEAWLYLTDGMRRARLAGSFGTWADQPFSRK